MLRSVKSSRDWLVALLIVGILAGCFASGDAQNHPAVNATKQASANGYVGSAACAPCHQGIAKSFAKASMGHSLTAITPDFLKTLPLPASYYDTKSNHHFEAHAENGKLYQSEYATDAEGKDVFRNTHARTTKIARY